MLGHGKTFDLTGENANTTTAINSPVCTGAPAHRNDKGEARVDVPEINHTHCGKWIIH
jgi:hypothetical protein